MEKDPILLGFYKTVSGHEPVREWLRSLPKDQRYAIGQAINDTQLSWPVGMPLVRKLEKALWEIRTSIPPREIARVVFTVTSVPKAIFLLHGFIKKSQKTPVVDLDTARQRMKGIRS